MIILEGNNSDTLSIALEDILLQVENINKYYWKLIWIDGVSKKFNIGKLMKDVNLSLDGYNIDLKKMLKISKESDQLIELVLIGDEYKNNLHKFDDDNLIKEKCEFFIELVDASYWEITSKNKDFLKKIKSSFMPSDGISEGL